MNRQTLHYHLSINLWNSVMKRRSIFLDIKYALENLSFKGFNDSFIKSFAEDFWLQNKFGANEIDHTQMQ